MNEFPAFSPRDYIIFDHLLNSSLKRHIIGLYILILKRVIQNTQFNPISFNELISKSDNKGNLKQEYLKTLLSSDQDINTIELLFNYKLLVPQNPKSKNYDFLPLEQILDIADKFSLSQGIEFDDDVFKTSSSGLALSLGVISDLLTRWTEEKISQAKIQKAIDELHTVPSRLNPHQLHFLFIPVDSRNITGMTKKKLDKLYALTDPVINFFNTYHPEKGKKSSSQNAELFIDLIELSLRLNTSIRSSQEQQNRSKVLLKVFDDKINSKKLISLSEKILCRELIIQNLKSIVTESSRYELFENKIRYLTDEGVIGWQIVKESEMTAINLPKIFESVDTSNTQVGVVSDFLVAYSRLMVAYLLNKAIVDSLEGKDGLFISEIGSNIMIELYNWIQNPNYRIILDQMQNLLFESKSYIEYYNTEKLKEILRSYLEH